MGRLRLLHLATTLESDGKGSPRKRVKGYNLIHSEKLSTPFHAPDNGGAVDVNVVFQVWSKHHTNETYTIVQNKDSDITIYSLSDGGTVATTRNKAMIVPVTYTSPQHASARNICGSTNPSRNCLDEKLWRCLLRCEKTGRSQEGPRNRLEHCQLSLHELCL